jgi:hypothetical protein
MVDFGQTYVGILYVRWSKISGHFDPFKSCETVFFNCETYTLQLQSVVNVKKGREGVQTRESAWVHQSADPACQVCFNYLS